MTQIVATQHYGRFFTDDLCTTIYKDLGGVVFKVEKVKQVKAVLIGKDGRRIEARLEHMVPVPAGTVFEFDASVQEALDQPFEMGSIVEYRDDAPDRARMPGVYVVFDHRGATLKIVSLGADGNRYRNAHRSHLQDASHRVKVI